MSKELSNLPGKLFTPGMIIQSMNTIYSDRKLAENKMEAKIMYANRNPFYLESLGYMKPKGFKYSRIRGNFFKRIELSFTNRHLRARLFHHLSTEILASASTTESKFRIVSEGSSLVNSDAVIMLARVFAERCLRAGCDRAQFLTMFDSGKERSKLFADILEDSGVTLKEPRGVYPHYAHIGKYQMRKFGYDIDAKVGPYMKFLLDSEQNITI